jgi:NADH-quinone oxidoreductase subunit G/NADP-reducing hydrogenase subunit HndD
VGDLRHPHVVNPYKCTCCGHCTTKCKFDAIHGPVGALSERNYVEDLLVDVADPDKIVVAQTAPAVRYALGEEFGMPPGTIVTGKMITALRKVGVDYVFDTDFGADITIMEEAAEIVDRLRKFIAGDKTVRIPITTSCCPAWVNFFENDYPDLREYPSTCKSPAQMLGAVLKSYWAERMGIPRDKLVVVSVMPCLSKKYECARDEFITAGNPDVDYSITTIELAELIKRMNIDFDGLQDGEFDMPLGDSSGAGAIFGTTGGVMEAALRTVYEEFTGKELAHVEFEQVRGLDGIHEAVIDLDGFELKVCVVNTLANARIVMDKLRAGELEYHVIEVMACPGGCIGGTGQPYHHGDIEVIKARQRAIYSEDVGKKLRKSHENPVILRLYREFLGEPLHGKAHEILHTKYRDKSIL